MLYTIPDMSKPHSIRMCDDTRVYADDVIVREFSLSVDGILNHARACDRVISRGIAL